MTTRIPVNPMISTCCGETFRLAVGYETVDVVFDQLRVHRLFFGIAVCDMAQIALIRTVLSRDLVFCAQAVVC